MAVKIKRHNGEFDSKSSHYCPICISHSLSKETSKESDFDEDGWYYPIVISCQNPQCKHKWTEKIYTPIGRF